jgi:hypothetical protein
VASTLYANACFSLRIVFSREFNAGPPRTFVSKAADWAEFPYKALGDKLRIVADPKADFGDKDVTIKSTIKDLTVGDE